jgi:Ca-activated chloride channel family protein
MVPSDLYPEALPDLFEGSTLLLAGRYQATRPDVTVRVRGLAGGNEREMSYTFNLDDMSERDFVPRLWATRRIGELLDRVRVQGESEALAGEIRQLGMGYGLVTPYTTFIIEGQAEGAASVDNMSLYGEADLNWATGRTTIQARVQNQAYQQAEQAQMAVGANVVNSGQRSLAQVGQQNLDLSLLKEKAAPQGPITQEWIEGNVSVDLTVEFGSDEYFELAQDAEARLFLQSGRNVLFSHHGKVISVQDPADAGEAENNVQQSAGNGAAIQKGVPQNYAPTNSVLQDIATLLDWLARFVR